MPSITDLTRRFERRPLAAPNATYYLWRFAANGIRTGRALVTPPAFDDTRTIASELTARGIVVGPFDRFLSQAGADAYRTASALIRDASRSDAVRDVLTGVAVHSSKKAFRIDLVKGAMHPDHPLLKLGLDVRLLEIVAAYLGMWPALHSIGAWLNYPTRDEPTSSQLWHRDPEDLKIIKVFIYLEDVGDENGPFTFIPGTHPFGPHLRNGTTHGGKRRMSDDQIASAFPPGTWRVCAGPAGTMILADTLGYHRGGKPSAGMRLLVTFTYTSGTPLVEHAVRLKREPTWIRAAIQRYAIKQLPITQPTR